jgi:hypothetical protein
VGAKEFALERVHEYAGIILRQTDVIAKIDLRLFDHTVTERADAIASSQGQIDAAVRHLAKYEAVARDAGATPVEIAEAKKYELGIIQLTKASNPNEIESEKHPDFQ